MNTSRQSLIVRWNKHRNKLDDSETWMALGVCETVKWSWNKWLVSDQQRRKWFCMWKFFWKALPLEGDGMEAIFRETSRMNCAKRHCRHCRHFDELPAYEEWLCRTIINSETALTAKLCCQNEMSFHGWMYLPSKLKFSQSLAGKVIVSFWWFLVKSMSGLGLSSFAFRIWALAGLGPTKMNFSISNHRPNVFMLVDR